MFNLLEMEFYKLKRSKSLYFLILISLLQAIVVYFFSERLKQYNGKDTLTYMFFIQSTLASTLFIGIFSADFIGIEFTSGYIKNLIAYGHKRRDIIISKAIVYFIGCIFINFISPVVVTIINTFRNGYAAGFNALNFINLISLVFTMIILQMATASISLLVIFVSKSPIINIGVIISLDFVFRVMNIIYIRYLATGVIYDNFLLSQAELITRDGAGGMEYLRALIIGLVTICLCISLTNYMFKKLNIK
ncbi:ABC transporter permease [Clostridium folliculivorans]|uniref:ABC transporter permease n=1 Tax=Clostridium folliculivorans TaxID=2886038 RepID=A0A9W5Y1X8_9CLOT|nr:ABC transporter permease [Clostridium folliculivorans]GKU25025.1 ABC transporter permease [Clostridium folliculivorans]GKU31123.1 ABC transporter permease [Clostridium folliculivorans]